MGFAYIYRSVPSQAYIRRMDGFPGTQDNILSPDYTEMGAGRVGAYWTQHFGSTEGKIHLGTLKP